VSGYANSALCLHFGNGTMDSFVGMTKWIWSVRIMVAIVGFMVFPVVDGWSQITWRRTYGGFDAEQAASVRQVDGGGYIMAGTSGGFGNGSSDIYVVRIDELGVPIWTRTYGGPGAETGVACREVQDGFVVAGSTALGPNGGYDMMLVRTDQNGVPTWERFYGTDNWDLLNAIDVLDDGFVLGGISYGSGFPMGGAQIIRTDDDGLEVWSRTIGGAHRVECHGIKATSDGGFIVVGKSGSDDRMDNGFFTKLDGSGNEVWTTFVGGDSTDVLNSVIEADGTGYVAIGSTESEITTRQIYLVKVDLDGELEWEQFIGNVADAGGTEVARGHGNEFVFTGYNTLNLGNRDMILTRTDLGGWFQNGFNYGNGRPADGYSVDITDDGGYVVAGWLEEVGPGIRAMYVVKTDANLQTASLNVQTYLDPLPVEEVGTPEVGPLYPNPARAGEVVRVQGVWSHGARVRLYDAQGRHVVEHILMDNGFPMSDLEAGWYAVHVLDPSGRSTRTSLVVQR
jgi:hypothetical protein